MPVCTAHPHNRLKLCRETAAALAGQGYKVILGCRNMDSGREAEAWIRYPGDAILQLVSYKLCMPAHALSLRAVDPPAALQAMDDATVPSIHMVLPCAKLNSFSSDVTNVAGHSIQDAMYSSGPSLTWHPLQA